MSVIRGELKVDSNGSLDLYVSQDPRYPEFLIYRVKAGSVTITQTAIPKRSSAQEKNTVMKRLLEVAAKPQEEVKP